RRRAAVVARPVAVAGDDRRFGHSAGRVCARFASPPSRLCWRAMRPRLRRRQAPAPRARAWLARLDRRLLRYLRTRGHGPAAEAAMRALGTAGEWGAVWAAIGLACAAADPGRRRRWLRAACVGPAAVGANYVAKLAVRRPRPDLGRRLPPLAGAPSALSFPSAHATASFAAAAA